MVSQSLYGSIIWFLNYHMVPLYGFSIIIWYPKIWFFNQNLVNYMFPNQTSAFSRYSATDSSKCASTTDSSCFRVQCKVKRGERWYHSIIHYNVEHFKGSYVRSESHISLILDYQFCACVMRTSGVPQLQVISIERLYGYK